MWAYGGRKQIPHDSDVPALRASNLVVRYPEAQQASLNGVSLEVATGAQVALVGHNGSGKSTFLKAVAGLLPLVSGSLSVYGQPAGHCQPRVAYLAQYNQIDWSFPITVRELALQGRYVHLGWISRPRAKDWQLVDETLERVGMGEFRSRQIGQLSGGQQQRTLLARALVQQADLLLLDEPLNALDPPTRQFFRDFFDTLKQEGHTLVVASHDTGCQIAGYTDVYEFRRGKLHHGALEHMNAEA